MSILRHLAIGEEPSPGRFLSFCALLAFVAGGIRAMGQTRTTVTGRVRDVVTSALASAVAGFLGGCLCINYMGMEKPFLVLPIVGITGWIGSAILDLAANFAFRQVQSRLDQQSRDAGFPVPTQKERQP